VRLRIGAGNIIETAIGQVQISAAVLMIPTAATGCSATGLRPAQAVCASRKLG